MTKSLTLDSTIILKIRREHKQKETPVKIHVSVNTYIKDRLSHLYMLTSDLGVFDCTWTEIIVRFCDYCQIL